MAKPPSHSGPAMPHPFLSSPNTTSCSSAPLANKHGPIWDPPPWEGVSELLRPGRGGGGSGRGWGGFEIIAMATPVKTVCRPGLASLHSSSQLQQVGPNVGSDVSHNTAGPFTKIGFSATIFGKRASESARSLARFLFRSPTALEPPEFNHWLIREFCHLLLLF